MVREIWPESTDVGNREHMMRRGFLYPELLLGLHELRSARRYEIEEFLVAVARQRGFPLHVVNLWNALYFGYDLDVGSYLPETISERRVPRRQMKEQGDYVPVGALMRVITETKLGDLWAEVVFREGRHPSVTSNWTPPEVSGAPGQTVEVGGKPAVVLSEALVLDFAAFGSGHNQFTESQFERISRKGKWLDRHGHFLIDAVYAPDEAELDDRTLYARYLYSQHREGLLGYALDASSDEDVWSRLLQSISTVAELTATSDKLVRWGDYFVDKQVYESQVCRDSADFPMGLGDLQRMFRELSSAPTQAKPSYRAVGPIIVDTLERDVSNRQVQELVKGVNYARSVVVANAYVLNRLRKETHDGLLPSGVHLRIDDAWQWGGIWRAQADGASKLIRLVPASVALHLGYVESRGGAPLKPAADRVVSTSMHGWRATLSLADLDRREIRLSESALEMLSGRSTVLFRLKHDGQQAFVGTVSIDRDLRVLVGIDWPVMDFFPGLRLQCQIERQSEVVVARTTRLAEPVIVDGDSIAFDCDPNVYLRFKGIRFQRPLIQRAREAASLRDIIHAAFRHHGRQTTDGARELTLDELVAWVFGSAAGDLEVNAIVATLESMEIEQAGESYLWRPRLTRRSRAVDRELLAAYGEDQKSHLERIVRRHWVRMHLRRAEPSPDKVAGYKEALLKYGYRGLLRDNLPEGFTWVIPHERSRDSDREGAEVAGVSNLV